MPKNWIRILLSILIVSHIFVVGVALIAHRGTSRLFDDMHSKLNVYSSFTNSRMDLNILPIATRSQLQESVWIQWHGNGDPVEKWNRWPLIRSESRIFWPLSLIEEDRQRRWLRQMTELLNIGNEDAVSQMLIALINSEYAYRSAKEGGKEAESARVLPDQIRVMVGPSIPFDRFEEIASAKTIDGVSEDLRPKAVYTANVIQLEDGKLAILPVSESRRLSKAIPAQDNPRASDPPASPNANSPKNGQVQGSESQ